MLVYIVLFILFSEYQIEGSFFYYALTYLQCLLASRYYFIYIYCQQNNLFFLLTINFKNVFFNGDGHQISDEVFVQGITRRAGTRSHHSVVCFPTKIEDL